MAGRIPIVAVGVPAAGLRGGWRDYCIVNAPERSGSGGVRGSTGVGFAAGVGGREVGAWSSFQARAAGPSTARCEAQGGGGAAAVVRLIAFGVVASAKREVGAPRSGGVVVVVHSATGGVADVTATERARRAESSTWLATRRQLARRHGGRKGNSPPFQLSVGLSPIGFGSV